MIHTLLKTLCFIAFLTLSAQATMASGEAMGQQKEQVQKSEIKGDIEAARASWALIKEGALLIDVRSVKEFESGNIEGSLNIPHTNIDALAQAIGSDHERKVVVYCRSGRRSGLAQKNLQKIGYTGIFNATGYTALLATKP